MMRKKQKKAIKPPKLLRGLFSAILVITSSILLAGWIIINYQVEQLVAQRTSEYAHSIATIAANSSAEALLSDDKIQLKMLVENVAKDPYIRSATVFAEDGQVIVKHPEESLELANPIVHTTTTNALIAINESDSLEKDTELVEELTKDHEENQSGLDPNLKISVLSDNTVAYIQSQSDIPFIEKIIYQDVTAGWFKISLNRELLESSFRTSLKKSQNIILVIALLLMTLLLFVTFKYTKRIKALVALCHRLIQVNAPQIPQNQQQWLTTFQALSETQIQALTDMNSPPLKNLQWANSRRIDSTIFCYCQFSMEEQDNEHTAASLSLAEQYLKSAVQTHGVQSQGEVLSGCLIPFLDNIDEEEAISEAISLVYLIQQLLASITVEIKVRAFVGKGTILVLENDRAVITGISLSNRLHNKINHLSPLTAFGDVICLGLNKSHLNQLGQFEEIVISQKSIAISFHRLNSISETIKQQTTRQINYIIDNYSES